MYSDENGRLIVVAGTRGDSAMLDGAGWTPLAPEPTRCCTVGAYDRPRNRFVLHGGSTLPNVVVGETLEFDGAAWRRVATNGPSARMESATAFDAARGVTVLFGGFGLNPNRRFDDHWEWDGVVWRQPEIGTERPSARNGAGMAYDSVRRELVLFGGFTTNNELLGDTWLFNGGRWRRAEVEGPSPRGEVFMAFDARREVVVLFGGSDVDASLADTWEWDGSRWTRRDVASTGSKVRPAPSPFSYRFGRLLRGHRIAMHPGSPLEPAVSRHPRQDLQMPVKRAIRFPGQWARVEDQVVGRPLERPVDAREH
jgi:hypothetical protein